jgi:signal transduction histidine kinase
MEKMHTIQPRILQRYELSLAAGWTLVICALCCINVLHERAQTLETARTQARSNFQRDVTYRQWNAASGSVYVEVSKQTPPNPYLSHIPERDVTTTTGKRLTLVNPAYMTRLVFDLAAHGQEVRGHISSLRPVRPQNLPDPWETSALQAFARGEKEVSSVQQVAGTSYLRLMSPLVTAKECLKCHGKDGYRLGDIRGGISVAVPMEPLWKISRQNVMLYLVSFTLLWLTGLAGIFLGAARLRQTIRQRDCAEQGVAELNRHLLALTAELGSANEELESFCATVSHDLRSPLTGIGGYCQLIQELPAEGHLDTCSWFAGIMLQETRRMETLIDTLLNFSRATRGVLARQTADLSSMAFEVAAELRLSSPGRRAQFRIADGVTADGDPALLRVVLQNLLGNSGKYTDKREEALIEFGVTTIGAETVYFVRDNGIGFDAADSERMFEAFRRLPNAGQFEGSGIGLATAQRIINRHGGRIWCEGELEVGATFYFTLKSH